ncbi:MAG: hypothetical protein WDW36_002022 [Sanguina aurantia]
MEVITLERVPAWAQSTGRDRADITILVATKTEGPSRTRAIAARPSWSGLLLMHAHMVHSRSWTVAHGQVSRGTRYGGTRSQPRPSQTWRHRRGRKPAGRVSTRLRVSSGLPDEMPRTHCSVAFRALARMSGQPLPSSCNRSGRRAEVLAGGRETLMCRVASASSAV